VLSPTELGTRGYRDGASLGYILRKHRYPKGEIARRLIRPVGGVLASLARVDRAGAAFYAATFRGRVRGLRASSDTTPLQGGS
jgi:hypothetical protein